MIKIALCDDELEQRALVKQMLQTYLDHRSGLLAKVFLFSSGSQLLSVAKNEGCFDIYILDIIMPEISGIELGVELRKLTSEGMIVYLTSSPEFAIDSYQAQAACYLLKPVEQIRFNEAMDRAVAALEKQKSACLMVKTRNGLQRVRIDDILYVELSNRTLRYHLCDSTLIDSVTLRTSFQEAIAPLLSDDRFFLAGSSFAVNLYYVSAIEKNSMHLDGGEQVFLTRAMLPAAKRQWKNYWLNDFPHN